MNTSQSPHPLYRAGMILVRIQRFFLFYLFLILVVAMLLELMVRFFLKQSIFGLSDFIGFASVWLYAIGAALASYDRTHIKAEFVNVFAVVTALATGVVLLTMSVRAGDVTTTQS